MSRTVRFAALAALALIASSCGARFDDDDTSGGLGQGTPNNTAVSTTSLPVPKGPGRTTGVTDTEIKIGYLLPLTGAAPIPSRFDKGVNAYWDYVNAQGGIDGRKVTVVIEDTESQAEVGKDKAKKLIEDDKVSEDADGVEFIAEVEDIAPGTAKPLIVDLTAGTYVVLCNIPGHYAAGMRTGFEVT